MKRAILQREETGNQGTFGTLTFYDGDKALGMINTGELPWRNNARGRSCICSGVYTCTPRLSEKFKDHFILTGKGVLDTLTKDPKQRDFVLIHKGNLCGDRDRGFVSHVDGCIIVGVSRGFLNNQMAVLSSGVALDRLIHWSARQSFSLEIRDIPGQDWSVAH